MKIAIAAPQKNTSPNPCSGVAIGEAGRSSVGFVIKGRLGSLPRPAPIVYAGINEWMLAITAIRTMAAIRQYSMRLTVSISMFQQKANKINLSRCQNWLRNGYTRDKYGECLCHLWVGLGRISTSLLSPNLPQ
jgi:hypothetical protein